MRRNFFYILGIMSGLVFSGMVNQAKAQISEGNILPEIKLNANDGFNNLRNLVVQNFDFTNPNLTEGEMDSVVKFSVKDGKLSNVSVNGRCKYVNEELKNVMTHLQYKFSPSDKRISEMVTYSFPVRVFIASR